MLSQILGGELLRLGRRGASQHSYGIRREHGHAVLGDDGAGGFDFIAGTEAVQGGVGDGKFQHSAIAGILDGAADYIGKSERPGPRRRPAR